MVECRKTLFAVVALVAALGAAASARAQGISEFALPTNASNPYRIAAGSDGNLWFTEIGGNKIGRITPSGVITEFPIPTANSNPQDITAGPDNNLWFTEDAQAGQIGRITTSGVITEFAIPTTSATPAGIIAGPDGNLWFAESVAAKIGRSTPAGAITEFAIPGPAAVPFAITAGSDGALWFTLNSGNTALGRITTSGAITQSTFPTTNSNPEGIVSGPDGALWFTEASVGNIRTVNTLATATAVFPIPTANSNPFGIAAGADGNLWFTEQNGNKIGRITTSGAFTEFAIPTANSEPQGIAAGPDGALWFVERLGNKIGRIAPPAAPTTVVASVLPSSQSVEVGTTATATATLINGGSTTASRCAIAPIGSVPATFSYQALAATGANTPVDIPAGGKASFSISLTPTVAIAPGINVTFSFACANAPPATVLTGINTLFLSAATAPVPNVVAAAIVANNSNGILVLNQTGSNTGAAQFSVSTTNQGIGASLTVSANTGAVTLPVTIALCQTDPTSGQCLAPPGPSVTLTINAGATPTFAVFVTATGVIPFNFNNNRIFVQFTTSTTGPNAAPATTTTLVNGQTSVAPFTPSNPSSGGNSLFAAVLPLSRSVEAGATPTAFATIINPNSSTATSCAISPYPLPANFLYQTTDPTTNALTGTANTPVDIAAGQAQSFVLALNPDQVFGPTSVQINFSCNNAGPAALNLGVDTLSLSASANPVPDVIALAASGDPGYVDVPGATGTGVFAVATINLGVDATITAAANTGAANLPLTLALCETNPSTGACMAAPGASVTTDIPANATPTFGIFVTGSAAVANSPGVNRVFVTFTDSSGTLRGETSVAVRTQ